MVHGGGELGRFLRARRARVGPEDVGLPAGMGMRRTPGLRREEMAALAGVSIHELSRLEQGKETNPSAGILDAFAGALLLDTDAHAHLYALANQAAHRTPPPRRRDQTREQRDRFGVGREHVADPLLESACETCIWRRAGRAAAPGPGSCFARGASTRHPPTSQRCGGVMILGRAGRCRSAERAKPTCRK
ncbi:MAG: helix-turn-helix domain-containing protein [Solirubrobacteraceae bacterium]